ncbi:unnamed protein product [Caenorhabditis sp. 36 PRJEB53466]|nr:unnamed protein product [Caenorhabditis sp. 36 PRJEB53466]
MAKFYGKVLEASPSTAASSLSDSCILAATSVDSDGSCHCTLYSVVPEMTISVEEAGNDEATYVAFKNWTRFERDDDNVVCMQVFEKPYGTKRTDAEAVCTAQDAVITGVGSVEECQWIEERLVELDPTIINWLGFWVDGLRNCSSECAVTQNFVYTDGYTPPYPFGTGALLANTTKMSLWKGSQSENCLSVTRHDGAAILNDVGCTTWVDSVGVACGYLLQKLTLI